MFTYYQENVEASDMKNLTIADLIYENLQKVCDDFSDQKEITTFFVRVSVGQIADNSIISNFDENLEDAIKTKLIEIPIS